jgi:hypothetical protein
MKATVKQIAKVCHNVNSAFCQSIGDHSQPTWKESPEWMKVSAIHGVEFHLQNPDVTPEQSHQEWSRNKIKEGWKHGLVKNPETKEHPCLVPYVMLPLEQRTKDYLFKAVVDSMRPKQ